MIQPSKNEKSKRYQNCTSETSIKKANPNAKADNKSLVVIISFRTSMRSTKTPAFRINKRLGMAAASITEPMAVAFSKSSMASQARANSCDQVPSKERVCTKKK